MEKALLNKNLFEEAVLELSTLRDMLRWGMSQFYAENIYFGHGTDNAWDEAVQLVLHTLHLPLDVNKHVLDANLTTSERKKIAKLFYRRISERIPAAYLTHEAWFGGLKFYVDERVLIPRSPLSELIEQQFSPWILAEKVESVLDLCTGSACIAIACAKAFPEAMIDAVDISADALAVAKQNVDQHGLTEQVHLIQTDLFDKLGNKKYDVIISNPPYVAEYEMKALPQEYRHEPALGLAAGEEGLDIAIKILQQAEQYLTDEGILIVEVGNSEIALAQRYPTVPFTWLEFQRGDGGVFLLTAKQLRKYKKIF